VAKIVLPLRGGPPPEPPYGGLGEEGWARGVTFYELVERTEDRRPTLESAFASCVIPAAMTASITDHRFRVRVLGLADADDSSSCAVIACAEHLFTLSPRIWMRVFDPASCSDLMHRYAPEQQSIPVFVFFGEDQREFARWRPLADPPEGAPDLRPFTSPEARTWVLQSLHEILEAQNTSGP
jgi:Thioredoxin